VADISTMIRVAVTGKTNSPDLYTVMQILGYERTVERIKSAIEAIS
jgi:glutamyl-tRNA synthetase